MTIKRTEAYTYTCDKCGAIEETAERGQKPASWSDFVIHRDQGVLGDKKTQGHMCPDCSNEFELSLTPSEVSEVDQDEAESERDDDD